MCTLCSWAYVLGKPSKIKDCSKKRVTEIDWEAVVLPLNYARESALLSPSARLSGAPATGRRRAYFTRGNPGIPDARFGDSNIDANFGNRAAQIADWSPQARALNGQWSTSIFTCNRMPFLLQTREGGTNE